MTETSVAAIQFEPTPGEVESNLDRMDELLARTDEISLAVFPEMGVTGYDLKVAEREAGPIPGRHTDRLAELAASHDVDIIAGVPERAGALYNDLVYVTPEGFETSYRKRRLWGEETDTFAEGTEAVEIETAVGTVGLLVCYDLNFPEILLEHRDSVDVLALSAAWRTDFLSDWQLLAQARAFDATSYLVGANHVGDQRGRDHAGHSLVVGPDGTVLAEADTDPGSVTATISQDILERARERNPVRAYRDG